MITHENGLPVSASLTQLGLLGLGLALHKFGAFERHTTGGAAGVKWLHSTNGAAIEAPGRAAAGSIVEHWEHRAHLRWRTNRLRTGYS